MSKLAADKAAMSAPTSDNGKNKTESLEKNHPSGRGVNFILYLMCFTSLGFSAYTSLCHSQLEDRIRHISHLDERVSVLEAKLRKFPIQFLQTLPSTTSSPPTDDDDGDDDDDIMQIVNRTVQDDNGMTGSDAATTEPLASMEFANVVRQLSEHMSGIQRLRRDVSHLKASRRGERQASISPPTECMCPPGKKTTLFSLFHPFSLR